MRLPSSADTFNRYFERENLDDAIAVLSAAGYRVHIAQPAKKGQAAAVVRADIPVGRGRRRSSGAREMERTLSA